MPSSQGSNSLSNHDVNINDRIDGKWEFNSDVTAVFDEMLERSIPQYDVMRETVTDIAVHVASNLPTTDGRGQIVDLGASRGEQAAQIIERWGDRGHYHLVEASESMCQALLQRFAAEREKRVVSVAHEDLRTYFPSFGHGFGNNASVVLSVLTLMFIPIEYRMQLVGKIYKLLQPGGALILVEKVLGASPRLDKTQTDLYRRFKRDNGYTTEEIDRKALSLEGVLVPVTASMNEEFLRAAGFTQVDCFYRWLNFAGWVAVK